MYDNLDISTDELSVIPSEWTLCVHPQGWIYFYNPNLQAVTDADIRKPDLYKIFADNYSQYPISDLDEGMEVQFHSGMTTAGFPAAAPRFNLVVNHAFCVASYDLYEVKGVNVPFLQPDSLNRRRRAYWNYLWNHPAHVPTPERAVADAMDALTWYHTDNLISGPRSVVPFSKLECEDLSRVVKDMTLSCNNESISKTVFLSWLLREVCSFRDSESYGQYTLKEFQAFRNARVHPAHSSHQPSSYALPVITFIINFLFFSIPWSYFAHVKSSSEYRGRLANVQRNWEDYIERLVREYSDFLLISTVLLSATVGFLAVPGIAEAAKVGATVSAFASLGSIIVGVFSIWRHQTNIRTADSFTYMHNARHHFLGFHGHAMLLSLPPVLLVWAIVTFTMSIVAYSLQGITDGGILDRASAWVVVGVFMVVLVSVIAALYTFSIIWKFQTRITWPLRYLRSFWLREKDLTMA